MRSLTDELGIFTSNTVEDRTKTADFNLRKTILRKNALKFSHNKESSPYYDLSAATKLPPTFSFVKHVENEKEKEASPKQTHCSWKASGREKDNASEGVSKLEYNCPKSRGFGWPFASVENAVIGSSEAQTENGPDGTKRRPQPMRPTRKWSFGGVISEYWKHHWSNFWNSKTEKEPEPGGSNQGWSPAGSIATASPSGSNIEESHATSTPYSPVGLRNERPSFSDEFSLTLESSVSSLNSTTQEAILNAIEVLDRSGSSHLSGVQSQEFGASTSEWGSEALSVSTDARLADAEKLQVTSSPVKEESALEEFAGNLAAIICSEAMKTAATSSAFRTPPRHESPDHPWSVHIPTPYPVKSQLVSAYPSGMYGSGRVLPPAPIVNLAQKLTEQAAFDVPDINQIKSPSYKKLPVASRTAPKDSRLSEAKTIKRSLFGPNHWWPRWFSSQILWSDEFFAELDEDAVFEEEIDAALVTSLEEISEECKIQDTMQMPAIELSERVRDDTKIYCDDDYCDFEPFGGNLFPSLDSPTPKKSEAKMTESRRRSCRRSILPPTKYFQSPTSPEPQREEIVPDSCSKISCAEKLPFVHSYLSLAPPCVPCADVASPTATILEEKAADNALSEGTLNKGHKADTLTSGSPPEELIDTDRGEKQHRSFLPVSVGAPSMEAHPEYAGLNNHSSGFVHSHDRHGSPSQYVSEAESGKHTFSGNGSRVVRKVNKVSRKKSSAVDVSIHLHESESALDEEDINTDGAADSEEGGDITVCCGDDADGPTSDSCETVDDSDDTGNNPTGDSSWETVEDSDSSESDPTGDFSWGTVDDSDATGTNPNCDSSDDCDVSSNEATENSDVQRGPNLEDDVAGELCFSLDSVVAKECSEIDEENESESRTEVEDSVSDPDESNADGEPESPEEELFLQVGNSSQDEDSSSIATNEEDISEVFECAKLPSDSDIFRSEPSSTESSSESPKAERTSIDACQAESTESEYGESEASSDTGEVLMEMEETEDESDCTTDEENGAENNRVVSDESNVDRDDEGIRKAEMNRLSRTFSVIEIESDSGEESWEADTGHNLEQKGTENVDGRSDIDSSWETEGNGSDTEGYEADTSELGNPDDSEQNGSSDLSQTNEGPACGGDKATDDQL